MRAPTMADLRYLGTVQGFTRNQWNLGDIQLGRGIGIRHLGDTGDFGSLRLYLGSLNPLQIIQADVPGDWTGTLRAAKPIGTLPCYWSMPFGVFYDRVDDKVYLTCANDYDGDPTVSPTLSRGRFDSNGMLVADGQWAFANRSDKMTSGGICELPNGKLGAGFGGYRSVVATGPASMGAALTLFDRPPAAAGPIPNSPLLSYPFSAQVVPRMSRPANFTNDIGGDSNYPRQPAPGEGYTTWCDWMPQCGVWIETANLSGLLLVAQRAVGRVWYTNTINADGAEYDLVCYGREILTSGNPENSYQPEIDEPFVAPGLPNNISRSWADMPPCLVAGVAYEPITQTLCVGIQNLFGSDASTYATGYLFFHVEDVAPSVSEAYLLTRAQVQQQTVFAESAEAALAAADPDDWEVVSESSSAERWGNTPE